MEPPHVSPTRMRAVALALVASLVIVAILWRLGVPDTIIYGLAGGLVACLLIVGRDRLLSAERRLRERDAAPDKPPREDAA